MPNATYDLVAKGLPADVRHYRAHPDVAMCMRGDVSVAVVSLKAWENKNISGALLPRLRSGAMTLVLTGRVDDLAETAPDDLFAVLPENATDAETRLVLTRAFDFLDTKSRAESRGQWLRRYRYELGELIEIARAMTTERDVNSLLGVILEKSRYVTGADAGSIYVVEDEGRTLRFKLSQNDSVAFDSREFTMPLSNQSIAGSAAADKQPINISDVYALDSESPFQFDQRFDEKIGYRTRSMLTVPLISQKGHAIGVIQLINKKRDASKHLRTQDDVDGIVIPFDERSQEIVGLVATQAAIALENAMLYAEIQHLFEGFVTASVEAIESRDPTTSGHSRRVANLTMELAKVVDSEQTGAYREARFSRDDLKELEYASLLHDFGKIGVKESVLVKAKKLYDERLEQIRQRFELALRAAEVEMLKRKVALMERGATANDLLEVDIAFASRKRTLETALAAIVTANEPSVLPEGEFAKIEEIAKETYRDVLGEPRWLLEKDEVHALMVRKGSLTPAEYDEIASHVSHTFRFLSRIPWGSALRRVPHIAGSHHERLNGTGYPKRLRAEEIPVGAKMMSIADIFDALTASDRPYKKAVPVERAIDIIDYGVRDGHVDPELVRLFKDARVWERAGVVPAKKP